LSSLENLARARRFFEQAAVIDSQNVYATLGVAAVDVQIAEGYYCEDAAARLVAAEQMILKARPHVLNVGLAHQLFGQLLILTNRAAYGIAECEQALALNRDLAATHALIGKAKSLMGRGEETEAHVSEALRLCPHHQYLHYMQLVVGDAKLRISADTEAITWLRRSIETNRTYPPTHFVLAAALALKGWP
jgi:tetratricopeptide (TPR) repeat protein